MNPFLIIFIIFFIFGWITFNAINFFSKREYDGFKDLGKSPRKKHIWIDYKGQLGRPKHWERTVSGTGFDVTCRNGLIIENVVVKGLKLRLSEEYPDDVLSVIGKNPLVILVEDVDNEGKQSDSKVDVVPVIEEQEIGEDVDSSGKGQKVIIKKGG